MTKKRLMAAAAAGLMNMTISACGNDDGGAEKTLTTIRVAHNSNAGVLTARIAAEKGFFEKQGIDVEFTQVENIETLPPALGKSFDIVLSTPTLLISGSARGIDMVEVAGTSVEVRDNPTAAVIASASSGVSSARDLEGKTIGVLNETGTLHTATKYWLDRAGVSLDRIHIVQVNPPAGGDQLVAGRIDAVETVTPFIDAILAKKGTVLLGYPHLEMAPEIGLILWAANGSWAKKSPAAVKGFRAALAEAVEWVKDPENETDARRILQNYTKLPEQVVQTIKLPTYSADPRPQDHSIWLDAMRRYAGFSGQVNLDDLVVR